MKKVLVLGALFASVAALTLNAQEVKKEKEEVKKETCCQQEKTCCQQKKTCCQSDSTATCTQPCLVKQEGGEKEK